MVVHKIDRLPEYLKCVQTNLSEIKSLMAPVAAAGKHKQVTETVSFENDKQME
jgi:hypothetical protein